MQRQRERARAAANQDGGGRRYSGGATEFALRTLVLDDAK